MRMLFVEMGLFTNHIALSMLLFFLVTTPLTLLVTHVVHHLVELGPYQWFFRQRIYRFRGTSGAGYSAAQSQPGRSAAAARAACEINPCGWLRRGTRSAPP